MTPESTSSAPLDAVDLQLVTALQTAPRADWRRIGRAIGVDASTAARRWDRLVGSGRAWLSCYPLTLAAGPPVVAVIELDCAPGQIPSVVAELADDPHLITMEQVTGGRDLLLTAVFGDLATLARYAGFRLGTLPGIAATRTQVATAVHVEGSRWRLERLDTSGREALARPSGSADAPRIGLAAEDEDLVRELQRDFRQPVTRLAERTGLSPSTVRRRIARLEAGGTLVYRCEVARSLSGWPVGVTLWAVAPPGEVADVAAQLAGARETRLCASLSGAANLMVTIWLRSIGDLPAFEARLGRQFPRLVVTDRAVTLWPVKLGGHVLDAAGRHLRLVPLALWTDPAADAAESALLGRLRLPAPR
ncbi:Lrp/AsnC family transcriptional regulator [Cryptosporangium aurantiacum]|uniref:DNA-binding transcriptional regulator, Lrp family n=1 Tax=Cryptosporangium aurantiacum TaxID=134849 RepID=A0A1M7RM52_9ACTN|nr:Lrp/AsnC family transcriptional regulator [Cryptosporangium aurantiacum]SHN47269.1 DNA-binding transcriptional regulator, Lrp family [Cryptosporangium aurantiacum]